MKSSIFSGSIGSKIIIAQEQYGHQKRLDQINKKKGQLSSTTINHEYLMRSSLRNPLKLTKKVFNEQMNHHLTLKHLIQRLNSSKSYNERLKDENDFIAYPSLFFRNNQNQRKKKKLKNKKTTMHTTSKGNKTNKDTSAMSNMNTLNNQSSIKVGKVQKKPKQQVQQFDESASVNSELPHNGLTLQTVVRQLPQLQKFEQEDIETFADHLTQIIFKYNLNSMGDIQYLFELVEEYLPEHYPENFVNAIEDIFRQIVTSLNIEN